jgi:hypothetical protein
MAVLIDGIEIFPPSSIDPTPLRIEREERTASGRLVVDTVAEKRSVIFNWSLIGYDELKAILDILSTGAFHQWTYPDPVNGEEHTITAKLAKEPSITTGGYRHWRNVSISIAER